MVSKKIFFLFVLFAASFLNQTSVHAAKFHDLSASNLMPSTAENGARIILMDGPVEKGDFERYQKIVADSSQVTLIVQGPGGLVREAYSIGADINHRGYATMVFADNGCYSSCAVIWLSGARRYMSETSKIGFHQVSESFGNVSGQGNARYGAYLNSLGLNKFAVNYLSSAKPEDIEYLNPGLAWVLGIDIYLQDGSSFELPFDNPTLPTLARQFVSLQFAANLCKDFLNSQAERLTIKAEEVAIPDIDSNITDFWVKYLSFETSLLTDRVKDSGVEQVCAEVTQFLSSFRGLIEHIKPSYDCNFAKSSSEKLICSNNTLAIMDNILNHIYKNISDDLLNESKQQAWLSLREECGSDYQCNYDVHLIRISQLKKFLKTEDFEFEVSNTQDRPSSIDFKKISSEEAILLQLALSFSGFYDGMQDGGWGNRSESARIEHKTYLRELSIDQKQESYLVDILKYEYGKYGWEYKDHHGIGANYLFPSKGFSGISSILPGGGHAIKLTNEVIISAGNLSERNSLRAHSGLAKIHDLNFGEPYRIRRKNLKVTVAVTRHAFLHMRSELTSRGWSTLFVKAPRKEKGTYLAVIGSFSNSRSSEVSLIKKLLSLE